MKTLFDIFPVDAGETLHSEGRYRYCLNGELTDIHEPWMRYQLPDGGQVIRTSRSDGKSFVLGVKCWIQANRTYASLFWANASGYCTANYRVNGESMRWNLDGETPEQLELDRPTQFFPLMRIFSGEILLSLLANGGSGQVLVPSIKSPERRETLFRPLFSERSVEALGSNTYHYRGGEYDDGARYELNDEGLLQRYSWQQSENQFWEVELV
ncbi:hypothetical protein FHR99_002230 [Litorivivens lipolytica]|uniref:Uncharacterized protein n=1 Tax=Litorivivens lipolytica TaxID=1524264 RepID=A0A7W4W5S9_9GAMM|nr:hypothetical protein [Litorivivens lipolytica]MBB3047964.1 hypothetical protein [Litorivivens lipolytica]